MATKSTGPKAAKSAATVLKSDRPGAASKSAAGSALSQTGNAKKTSSTAASAASKVLRDGRTGADSKSAAGSALAQKKAAPAAAKRAAPRTRAASGEGTSSGGPRKKIK
jgi:hypothetical protein